MLAYIYIIIYVYIKIYVPYMDPTGYGEHHLTWIQVPSGRNSLDQGLHRKKWNERELR